MTNKGVISLLLLIIGVGIGLWQYNYTRSETTIRPIQKLSLSVTGVEIPTTEPDYCDETGCYARDIVTKVGFPLTAEVSSKRPIGIFTRYRGTGVKMTLETNFFIFTFGLPVTGYLIYKLVERNS